MALGGHAVVVYAPSSSHLCIRPLFKPSPRNDHLCMRVDFISTDLATHSYGHAHMHKQAPSLPILPLRAWGWEAHTYMIYSHRENRHKIYTNICIHLYIRFVLVFIHSGNLRYNRSLVHTHAYACICTYTHIGISTACGCMRRACTRSTQLTS